jgi:BlaI family penicillinase repressor
MPLPKLSKLEMQIMEALWTRGACSIREIQEAFPERRRPAYTTVQTTVYRLEIKKAVRLALFGGRTQPVMAHLIESGKLTLDDVQEAEKTLRDLAKKEESK